MMQAAPPREPQRVPCPPYPVAAWVIIKSGSVVQGYPTRSLSRLKIDRSLVAGVTRDQGIQAIVKATIDLAQSSGLEVVANGIETEEQLRWLRFHGCDHGQGNHLGPPLPGTDFLNR